MFFAIFRSCGVWFYACCNTYETFVVSKEENLPRSEITTQTNCSISIAYFHVYDFRRNKCLLMTTTVFKSRWAPQSTFNVVTIATKLGTCSLYFPVILYFTSGSSLVGIWSTQNSYKHAINTNNFIWNDVAHTAHIIEDTNAQKMVCSMCEFVLKLAYMA